MKIGAYQFSVTKNIKYNLETVKKAIIKASHEGGIPECSLTGYPPRDIENSSVVNFQELNFTYKQLQSLVDKNAIHIIIGTIIQEDEGKISNF